MEPILNIHPNEYLTYTSPIEDSKLIFNQYGECYNVIFEFYSKIHETARINLYNPYEEKFFIDYIPANFPHGFEQEFIDLVDQYLI